MDKDRCLYEIMQCKRCSGYVNNHVINYPLLSNYYTCDEHYAALKACLDAEKEESICQSKPKW